MNITVKTRTAAITSALRADGYAALVGREDEIRRAALTGALLWTRERLTTTDKSRIDARPKRTGHEGQRTLR